MLASISLETPVLGLVGRADSRRFELAPLRSRLATLELPQPPAAFGIDDDLALFGSFVAGPTALARLAAGAPLNTDDRPVVAYAAPRLTYAPDSLPRERLLALLGEVSLAPQELMAASTDAGWLRRLGAYAAARNSYLMAGRDVRPSADVRVMLRQVREPLLAALRTSPDFRPAYDPLLHMAEALARSDLHAARALFEDLANAQPARPEAAQALTRLN
jgi:spermidine synthase